MSARLVRKSQVTREVRTGQLSGVNGAPGPDFAVTLVTRWVVVALDRAGVERTLEFESDPTPQQIIDRLGRPQPLVPTTKVDLEDYLEGAYNTWLRWRTTRQEAQARTLPAPVIAALTAREDSSWASYLAAIQAWRAAP